MKKVLLFLAAVALLPLAANAQVQTKSDLTAMKSLQVKAVGAQVSKDVPMQPQSTLDANRRAPRRVVGDEVWYKRPEGSLLLTSTQSSSSKYSYVVLPPYVDQKFINMSTNKDGCKWLIGDTSLDADEDGNFTYGFGVPPSGYVDYLPVLQTADGDEFIYAEELTPKSSYCLPVDTVYSLTNLNLNGGYYSGFSNGYVFGTHTTTYTPEDGGESQTLYCDYITEYYEKPASTMYLTDIWFHYNSDSPVAIPEGTDMTLQILKVLEDGSLNLDEPIATMTFNMNDTLWTQSSEDGGSYGAIMVSQKEKDAFGTELEVPVFISDEFAIRISGFHQPGVDFSLYMAQVYWNGDPNVTEDAYEFGGNVYPTVYSYVTESGEFFGSNWQYIQGQRQFNAVIRLDAMFDVAQLVDEGFSTFTVPVEGGTMQTVKEFELTDGTISTLNYIDVYTTLPWVSTWEESEGDDNYYIVMANEENEFPDWLEVSGFQDDYAESNSTLIQFSAQALPADQTGRYAQIRIVSDKGADSGVITIAQGDVNIDELSVNTVKADKDINNNGVYSLAGKRLNASAKGIIIQNGKKFIRK